ncbi:MAG: methyltransferase [Candidatus Thiodiazotropha endolucinida]|uniref:Methyltransferase n=1 Tax=Candidatus Thiodiazotropha taylori TaxID=2792791 RepID=A0A9E4NH80_9GAMM|nr:methyltransferase [Candidatus Thiodiazotropha taylori]MCW4235376.1 methyltransferase [Candidatus Thiodiazotropha endolucinida]
MTIDLRIKDPSNALLAHSKDVLNKALTGDLNDWQALLAENSEIDGLSLIYSHHDNNLMQITLDERGRPSLSWLIRHSRSSTSYRRGAHSNTDLVLSELWRNLQRKITILLEARSRDLPDEGYALYFTEELSWCIVFSYKFSGNAAIARVVHYTKSPQSVYDIFALPLMSDEHTRTVIKNVVRSKSKVIIHRCVLIEVDRYFEDSVFGPTIDTLYLNEFVSRLFSKLLNIIEHKHVTAAMEIGCGNGLLTAGLASKCSNLKRLVAIDTEVQAIHCTTRNVQNVLKKNNGISFYGVVGEFTGDLLSNKFDIVLSNPPYLPYRDNVIEGDENSQRIAIKGTELIEEMVKNSPFYLSPDGALIIVYSDLAEQELKDSIPKGMIFTSANDYMGYRVLFDLEDVMDNPKWLSFLISRGLEHDSSSSVYHHRLKIGIITHEKSANLREKSISQAMIDL